MTVAVEYPIVDIPQDAREDIEQLGSKPKFWVSLADGRWLFKVARPNTGEDWAEKVAAELAKHLDIEAADVELASYVDLRGCVSKLNEDGAWQIISRIPAGRASDISKQFAPAAYIQRGIEAS